MVSGNEKNVAKILSNLTKAQHKVVNEIKEVERWTGMRTVIGELKDKNSILSQGYYIELENRSPNLRNRYNRVDKRVFDGLLEKGIIEQISDFPRKKYRLTI